MKKNTAITVVLTMVLTGILVYGLCATSFGSANTPGSSEDPLVSKSYVDNAVLYEVVHLEANQKLLGDAGAEIILRSGEATAIGNGSNGVSDLTSGVDLMTTDRVNTNHLLLVPRNDGRGIQVWTESYVMVRGNYTVK